MQAFVRDVENGRHAQAGWPSSGVPRVEGGPQRAGTRAGARTGAAPDHINAVCPGWVRTDMGGRGSRGVDKGAASIMWAARHTSAPTGGFFRDGRRIDW